MSLSRRATGSPALVGLGPHPWQEAGPAKVASDWTGEALGAPVWSESRRCRGSERLGSGKLGAGL